MDERKYGENVTVHEYNGAHTGKKRTATLWSDGTLEYVEPTKYPPTKPRHTAHIDYRVARNNEYGFNGIIYVKDVVTGELVVEKTLVYETMSFNIAKALAEVETLKLAKEAGFTEIREKELIK